MARLCWVSAKKPLVGCHVSHANNKTLRVFRPNLRVTSVYSQALGRFVSIKISAAGMRTLDKHGGLDAFLDHTPIHKLTVPLAALKRKIKALERKKASPHVLHVLANKEAASEVKVKRHGWQSA